MGNMRFNVGDRVRIKSFDWYNMNKNADGFVYCGDRVFDDYMSVFCGSIVTIEEVFYNGYGIQEDMQCRTWTDEMIEGLVEEETKPEPKFKIGEVVYVIDYDTDLKIQNRIYKNGMWNYIINIESAPFIFYDNELKKKKEYPKTYEECRRIMDIDTGFLLTSYDIDFWKGHLLTSLQKLLICRDAYWKIAGDEMGKPWSPTDSGVCYGISSWAGKILHDTTLKWCILTFPTEEMRDAFYENFKEEIELCKELL